MSSIDKINVGGVDFDIGGTAGAFYDSYEEALEDIDNIEDGTLVYTPDAEPSVQDAVDGMTALHLAGSQVGAGTKNFTFNTEAQKRMLCITKKSGVIVESKEIPVDVLDTDDVILLGNTSPVIGGSGDPNLVGKALYLYSNSLADNPVTVYSTTGSHIGDHSGITLTTDSSNTTGATLTYNGNNSFTINVADSTLSVYVYVDMLVLGGSASGRNVSVNLAGTDLVSTDAEGAIKEVNTKATAKLCYPDYTNKIQITTLPFTAPAYGLIRLFVGNNASTGRRTFYINNKDVGYVSCFGNSSNGSMSVLDLPVYQGDVLTSDYDIFGNYYFYPARS